MKIGILGKYRFKIRKDQKRLKNKLESLKNKF